MSFNNYNQNANKPAYPSPTVYAYRFNNAESSIDQTCITFRYWNGNLCIGIFPRKNTGNDNVAFDMDNGITIYLSYSKAAILSNEWKKFMADRVSNNCCGVNSGSAAITISNGAEYGADTPVITIRKIDESGNCVGSFAYELKSNYYFSIVNYDGKNFNNNYDDYKSLELELMIGLMDNFVAASTNATAYTVLEQSKYDTTRTNNKIDSICASLGIDNKQNSGNGGKRYNSNSYFGNNNNANSNNYNPNNGITYGTATIDDLE